ncbi:MAG: FAD/NAD(P)-binding protein [Ilumatobacteraceae bacterium]
MEPIPHRVLSRVVEAPKVVSLRIKSVGHELPISRPGQFMMLWMFGIGEVPISVSNVEADGSLDFTVQAVGATSTAITAAKIGDIVGLRGPFGTEWPMAEAEGRDVLVMAGGLGLAPLRMAIDGLVRGHPAPRSLTLLVGARSPSNLLFADDLTRWAGTGTTVRTAVDSADRSWPGAVGVVTTLLEREPVRADLAFVCGPEMMMAASVRALLLTGMPAEHIYVSLERNMHCGIAHCGRCQLGPLLLCRDGAVVRWDRAADLVAVRGR